MKKEQIKKFNIFINHWLKSIENHPLSLFFQTSSKILPKTISESPPSVTLLWKSTLLYLLPKSYIQYTHNDNDILTSSFKELTTKLSCLTGYTNHQAINQLLQSNLIFKLPDIDRQRWVEFIFNFNKQINVWVAGQWNQKLIENKQSAILQITKTIQFNTPWETSQFLVNLGYPIHYSLRVNRVWDKFSGQVPTLSDYQNWVDLFQSLNEPETELFAIERKIDAFISYLDKISQAEFCNGIESCESCCLKVNCHFYSQFYDPKVSQSIETQVKLDKVRTIDKDVLLLYILKSQWQGSDNQKKYLSKYPQLEIQDLLVNQNNQKDESFFLKLIGIQSLIERDDLAPKIKEGQSFTNSESIYNFYRFTLSREKQESFFILILDNKHKNIKLQRISQGILNKSLVHPREVFAPAIQLRAAAIILIHNHPSGDPSPSSADINITRRLVQVGEIIGISVLDHVIIGKNSYYSFIDEDRMPSN